MKAVAVEGFAEFQRSLARNPQLLSDTIDQLTVGETYFFREHQHFEFIRQTVIPDFRARSGHHEPIRTWSAGCATGEEAYSLAIVFTQEHAASTILATDLSTAAIEKAQRAVFRPWSFRGQASDAVRPFVTESEDQFTLSPRITRRVQFQRLNLASNTYPSSANGTCNMDLILCRNVLIYFGSETVGEISRRLFACLAPGGWLITASGDPQLVQHADYEVVACDQGVFYRRPRHAESASKTTAGSRLPTRPASDLEALHRATESPLANSLPANSLPANSLPANSLPANSLPANSLPANTAPANSLQAESALRPSVQPVANHAGSVTTWDTDGASRGAGSSRDLLDDSDACLAEIKRVAATDPIRALEICRPAAERHPLVEELHYLHGVLLADADQPLMALESIRKAIFLNRSSVMSHFLFASIQNRQGQYGSAHKHFRRVCELCALGNPNEVLPMSNGETVAEIAVAAQSQLARLESRRDP
ncbi:CheR family methyltransferase [Stieleria neptunia]|nr:protein-glutamate O-methyltransferase CheR [Stieleria neptunia]